MVSSVFLQQSPLHVQLIFTSSSSQHPLSQLLCLHDSTSHLIVPLFIIIIPPYLYYFLDNKKYVKFKMLSDELS